MAGVDYLISERVVVPSTEGCCKASGSEHHADDQGELHLSDSSEVGGIVWDGCVFACLCLERYEEHSRSIALYITLHARLLPSVCTLRGSNNKAQHTE